MLPELRTMNEGIMARVVDVAKCTIVRLPNDVIEAISEKVSKDSFLLCSKRYLPLVLMEVAALMFTTVNHI